MDDPDLRRLDDAHRLVRSREDDPEIARPRPGLAVGLFNQTRAPLAVFVPSRTRGAISRASSESRPNQAVSRYSDTRGARAGIEARNCAQYRSTFVAVCLMPASA